MRFGALISALAAASTFWAGSCAQAGMDVGSFYVAPEVLGVSAPKLGADDGLGYRLAIGQVLSEKWDAELGFAHTDHAAGIPGKTGNLSLGFRELDFNRVFHREENFNPFITFGVGFARSSLQNVSTEPTNRTGAKLGVGFLYGAASHALVQFIGSAGLRLDPVHNGVNALDPYASLGARFYLGGARKTVATAPVPVAVAPPPPAPVDSDGDGVPDNLDRCPNTPAGSRVDANGCEIDSDRDGVVDRLDMCPNTPAGAKVDGRGCELDSDGDGVVDRLDRCPNTPRGDKVDVVGCGLTIELQVLFDTNSANIKPASLAELDSFADFLNAVPSATGVLEGHTDSVGKPAYNLGLSQRRAEAVRAYVLSKGIAASRLSAKGFGATRPVADNKTEDGRAANRRVLFSRKTL